MHDVSVVIMTRNRRQELAATLDRLHDLPERPPIVVADNGSSDGTSMLVRTAFPDVHLLRFDHNAGVAARNAAVAATTTPYVAFNDDDSWWAPGSLDRVATLFDRHPTLGAVTARVVVEPSGRDDAVSTIMRDSPLTGDPAVPGIPVLGFLACATAVRRAAFDEVGGFEERLHFAGEEALLATDLASRGWQVRFDPDLQVHHQASTLRQPPAWRKQRELRNALWTLWLRRPTSTASRRSWELLRKAEPRTALGALGEALLRGGWIVRARQVVPPDLENQLRRLDEPAPSRT